MAEAFPLGTHGPPQSGPHGFQRAKRRALAMTETELRLIAAPATMGLSSQPVKG